jgi:hypothetical protein
VVEVEGEVGVKTVVEVELQHFSQHPIAAYEHIHAHVPFTAFSSRLRMMVVFSGRRGSARLVDVDGLMEAVEMSVEVSAAPAHINMQ